MPYVRIASMHKPAEFVIGIIRENCKNMDDLSKIAVSVDCMIEDCSIEKEAPTLKQLMMQEESKTE
jgi:hypothetical protein